MNFSSSRSDPIVWIIPCLVLFFGVCTITMALLGCSGMAIENKVCSIAYFSLQLLILLGEIAVGGYWIARTQEPIINSTMVRTAESFAAYDIRTSVRWTELQTEMNCCGSNGPYDYPKHVHNNTTVVEVPKECCLSEPSVSTYRLLVSVFDRPCEAAYVRKRGCKLEIAENMEREKWFLIFFTIGGAFLKLVMLLSSFCIPFEEITEEIGWSPIGSRVWLQKQQQVEQSGEVVEIETAV